MLAVICAQSTHPDLHFFLRFLIEGSQGAILHTGDFRAEPWFLESLSRNPYLQPYLDSSAGGILHRGLDCIYLDTACAFSLLNIPSKVSKSVLPVSSC